MKSPGQIDASIASMEGVPLCDLCAWRMKMALDGKRKDFATCAECSKAIVAAMEKRKAAAAASKERVLSIRCHPDYAELASERFSAENLILDPTLDPPDRILVTPLAYAEKIECEIGFVNPEGPKESS